MKKNKTSEVLWLLLGAGLVAGYFAMLPPVKRAKEKRTWAILLGCPARDDGSLSTSQKKRLQLAADKEPLYENLLVCGGAVKNRYVESEVLGAALQDRILAPVTLEKESRTTWQNLQNARAITGDVPVLLLTSGTHARRVQAMANQFYSDAAVAWVPEHRPRHILREAASQWTYIWMELKKRI